MKNNKKYKLFILSIITVLSVVYADQKTKNIVLNKIVLANTRKYVKTSLKFRITPFLNIVLVWNSGVSFGIFNGTKVMSNLILLITTFIACYLAYFIWKNRDFKNKIFFSLILGGAIGNIIDRTIYGAVIDFIDLHIGKYHWPAFNIADSSIFIGVFMYLLSDIIKTKTIDKSTNLLLKLK